MSMYNMIELKERYLKRTLEKDPNNMLKTGFSQLDAELSDSDSGLILLGSSPSMGRTAFILSIIDNLFSNDNGESVVFYYTRRHDPDIIYERLLSIESKVPVQKIVTNELSAIEKEEVARASRMLSWRQFYISDSPMTQKELFETLDNVRELGDGKLDLVIIDSIESVLPDSYDKTIRISSDIEMETSFGCSADEVLSSQSDYYVNICKEFRDHARMYGYHIIGTLTIANTVMYRSDHKPDLADTRNYGTIYDVADIVLLLYRRGYYDEYDANNCMQTIIAKNDYGRNGVVTLSFNTKTTGIGDYQNFDDELGEYDDEPGEYIEYVSSDDLIIEGKPSSEEETD